MSGDDAELEVGERADGERHLLARQPLDQGGVLERAVAVVEPVDLAGCRAPRGHSGRAFLAGMGDALQAERGGGGEDPGELRRRMAELGGVEADRRRSGRARASPASSVANAASSSRWRRKQRISFEVMPCRASASAMPASRPSHHRVEGDAAVGVGLRIEEDLGMDDIVRRRAVEIGGGEVAEIRLGRGARPRPDNRCRGSPAGWRSCRRRAPPRRCRTGSRRRCASPARTSVRARGCPRYACAARPWAGRR